MDQDDDCNKANDVSTG